MNLARLNPFAPKEPAAFAEFQSTYKAELKIYRKRPLFVAGFLMTVVFGFILIRKSEFSLLWLPFISGLAIMHDTITSHFTKRLIESRNGTPTDSANEEKDSLGSPDSRFHPLP